MMNIVIAFVAGYLTVMSVAIVYELLKLIFKTIIKIWKN